MIGDGGQEEDKGALSADAMLRVENFGRITSCTVTHSLSFESMKEWRIGKYDCLARCRCGDIGN